MDTEPMIDMCKKRKRFHFLLTYGKKTFYELTTSQLGNWCINKIVEL